MSHTSSLKDIEHGLHSTIYLTPLLIPRFYMPFVLFPPFYSHLFYLFPQLFRAPFVPVHLRHSYAADILCSFTKVFAAVLFGGCYFTSGAYLYASYPENDIGGDNFTQCTTNSFMVFFKVCIFVYPYYIRLMQCLRQQRDHYIRLNKTVVVGGEIKSLGTEPLSEVDTEHGQPVVKIENIVFHDHDGSIDLEAFVYVDQHVEEDYHIHNRYHEGDDVESNHSNNGDTTNGNSYSKNYDDEFVFSPIHGPPKKLVFRAVQPSSNLNSNSKSFFSDLPHIEGSSDVGAELDNEKEEFTPSKPTIKHNNYSADSSFADSNNSMAATVGSTKAGAAAAEEEMFPMRPMMSTATGGGDSKSGRSGGSGSGSGGGTGGSSSNSNRRGGGNSAALAILNAASRQRKAGGSSGSGGHGGNSSRGGGCGGSSRGGGGSGGVKFAAVHTRLMDHEDDDTDRSSEERKESKSTESDRDDSTGTDDEQEQQLRQQQAGSGKGGGGGGGDGRCLAMQESALFAKRQREKQKEQKQQQLQSRSNKDEEIRSAIELIRSPIHTTTDAKVNATDDIIGNVGANNDSFASDTSAALKVPLSSMKGTSSKTSRKLKFAAADDDTNSDSFSTSTNPLIDSTSLAAAAAEGATASAIAASKNSSDKGSKSKGKGSDKADGTGGSGGSGGSGGGDAGNGSFKTRAHRALSRSESFELVVPSVAVAISEMLPRRVVSKFKEYIVWPYSYNAFRYFLSILVIIFGSYPPTDPLAPQYMGWYYALYVFATLFNCYWDVFQDFQLLQFNSDKPLLRIKLFYEETTYFYYIVLVLNPILRFLWTLSFTPYGHQEFLVLIEIIRRSLWACLRMEVGYIQELARRK